MISSGGCTSSFAALPKKPKVLALETNLKQCVVDFRELITDLEFLQIESENTKSEYISLKERCDSKTCSGAEQLYKEITKRDEIIQSVASLLTKLYETHDMDIINIAFKILCQDSSPVSQPEEKDFSALKDSKHLNTLKGTKDPNILNDPTKYSQDSNALKSSTDSKGTKDFNSLINQKGSKDSNASKDSTALKDLCLKTLKHSPKELDTSITEDVSFKEESLCEIEGTPTGRQSPIMQSKWTKNNLGKSLDFREKKKLPNEWTNDQPNSKAIKLTFTTPRGTKGGLKQSKISVIRSKPSLIVDLTCSPELDKVKQEFPVQALVKKESIENDDTILPSPTSGPSNFNFKQSPAKWKKPTALSLVKTEKISPKPEANQDIKDMEESINILNRIPDRLKTNIKCETPTYTEAMDIDATRCDTEFSVSLLDRVKQLEKQEYNGHQASPLKRPLSENINVINTPPKQDPDTSVSLLRPVDKHNVENVKRKIELIEPIYKVPAPRNKLEKRALQGWSCDECKNFYGALYKDDPVMLARKIEECSKHRGKHNPARPKTPEGYWDPRWEVPQDTDELNRLNDAL